MITGKNVRLAVMAAMLMAISTLAVLLARQFTDGPTGPVPAWRTVGPEKARIQIYEYTDFGCPACRRASELIADTLKIYGQDIHLSFKHYPLTHIHPWSMDAAAYADCAGEQGKFGEYAELLFKNQDAWAEAKTKPAQFETFAGQLQLDWPKMQLCHQAPGTLKRLTLDMAEGDRKRVDATPTFFINGKRYVGGGQLLDQVRNFDNLLKIKQ